MGSPSKTEVEGYTDLLAALIQKDLDGYTAEVTPRTIKSLFDQVDASADPAVQIALGVSALAVDNQSLPENWPTALNSILGRTDFRTFASALMNHVTTAGGGSYASFRAYLAAISAQLHPLAAELFRNVGGEGALTNSDGDVTTVFAPNRQSRTAALIYTGADGALVDDTADAASATAADVALFATNGHSVYIGSRYKFCQVVLGLSTLGSHNAAYTVSYWNGNAWTAVADLTDSAVGLTKNDRIKWTLPTDWTRHFKDGAANEFTDKGRLYWVKLTRTAVTLSTPPVATTIRIIPEPVYHSGTNHLGVEQGPLAIARVTAANTLVVEALNGVSFARFAEPATVKLRALTPIAGTVTLSLDYVEETGANATAVQSAWSSIDPLDLFTIVLSGADGLRSVRTSSTSVHTATEGVFEVLASEARTPAV